MQVETIGYCENKTGWVRHSFQTFNFSFILGGGGEYRVGDLVWEVRAPCVITQRPGLHVEYGPAGQWSEWEELYLIYNRKYVPELTRNGFVKPGKHAWYIRDPAPTRKRLAELANLSVDPHGFGNADRIDRLCELMVMESLLGEVTETGDEILEAIHLIRDEVSAGYLRHHDFNALALEHGFSRSAFRRHWERIIGIPPARYVMQLRIREACRLLVETDAAVGEVADKTGFENPLYFSRKFRKETGMTATEYRKRHRSPLSLALTE